MREKLLLVDGHNLLFQMYFGMPARIKNRAGEEVHGIVGFVGALRKIIQLVCPTYVLVIFDREQPPARREIDPAYKGNRKEYAGEEQNPFTQLPGIYRSLEFLGIHSVEAEDGEADDLIASYALAYHKKLDVVIASHDADFFQLVTESVSLLRYRGKATAILGPGEIMAKLGVESALAPDVKALAGDLSDNIRGVKGVGPKTAAELINEFGGIQALAERYQEIARPRLRDTIEQSLDRIQRNYRMIKLEGGQTLPSPLEELAGNWTALPKTGEVMEAIGMK